MPETNPSLALIADIGGSNARFAVVRGKFDAADRSVFRPDSVTPESIEVLQSADYDSFEAAIDAFLSRAGIDAGQVVAGCLAVAGPVGTSDSAEAVQMTNQRWRFTRDELRQRYGWRFFKLLNDFSAMALGVLNVDATHRVDLYGRAGPAVQRKSMSPILVFGPGTGLGVSALVPGSRNWIPLATEGGHVDFAPVSEMDDSVLKILRNRLGRVSAERLLSGQGLVNLYLAHAEIAGVEAPLSTAEEISSAGLSATDDDELPRKVLFHFCEILGRVCGNAVLSLGAFGGVYLCGGIVIHLVDFLRQTAFQIAFEDKGRMGPLLENTPVYVITDSYTGLLGAAEALRNPEVQ